MAKKTEDKTEQVEVEAPATKISTPAPSGLKTIEVLALELNTPDWLMAGVKFHFHWGIGKEVTEAQFVAACEEVGGLKISAYSGLV